LLLGGRVRWTCTDLWESGSLDLPGQLCPWQCNYNVL